MQREAKSSLILRHWLKANLLGYSCTFEMKDTLGTTSLPFREVADEQIAYARAIEEGSRGVLLRNRGGSGEPDYTYHYKQPAYIVIKYPKVLYGIRINDFIKEKCVSRRKSLTEDRAKEIAELEIKL